MKQVYPVIFTKIKGAILVEVPDLALLTEGVDLADAIDMARDAIGLKGISLEDAMEEIPLASEVGYVDVRKGTFENEGDSFISLVDVDFLEYRRRNDSKMVRRNITLPNWLNLEADRLHLNVSKVLQEALAEKVNFMKLK